MSRQKQPHPTTVSDLSHCPESLMRLRLMNGLGIDDTFEDEFEYFAKRTMDGTCKWLLRRRYFRD